MRKRQDERNVGQRIRELRKTRRLQQKKLAQMVGISHGALTNFEKGRRRISLDWLQRISEALDTPIAYFLPEEREKRSIPAGDARERRLLNAWRRLRSDILRKDFLRLMAHLGNLRGIRKPKQ
jgi:transcriptional regulator with XRE-family HTH domain